MTVQLILFEGIENNVFHQNYQEERMIQFIIVK